MQDRIMIAITTMMVVATVQASIDKMVPKTGYYKMIDYWLLYSFNIIIIIMVSFLVAQQLYRPICLFRCLFVSLYVFVCLFNC